MRLLPDAHAFPWRVSGGARLSPAARQAAAADDIEIFVGAAGARVVATRQRPGKLEGVPQIVGRHGERVAADGFQQLAVDRRHALRAGGHAADRRDPFGRMRAAQGEIGGLPRVARDPALALFGARTFR